jgi:ribosomal protein S18 acetylase RimI-like enzyme
MDTSVERIAELEWANCAASQAIAQVAPGFEVILRDDVAITSVPAFPMPDTNNACLLRATPQAVDNLIAEVTDHFTSRGLPVTIYISPACTPADLGERLLSRGFARQEEEEAWLVLDDLLHFKIPVMNFPVVVRQIARDEITLFAEVFMAAFEMPAEFAPFMAQFMEPWAELPSVHHYVGFIDGQAVGTTSLICHEHFGILGSGGVVPAHRRSGVANTMVARAFADAQSLGIDTLILQTAAGTLLERTLRLYGFRRAFTRVCYTLS